MGPTDIGRGNATIDQPTNTKASGLTIDMRSRVNRLLTRNDQRVYAEQLERDLAEGVITATQKASNWTSYMQLTMEAKRHEANLIRTRLGRQLVPWGFGQPPIDRDEMALNATRGAAARRSRKKRRSQAPSETPQGSYRDSHGTDTGQATWFRWEELLFFSKKSV